MAKKRKKKVQEEEIEIKESVYKKHLSDELKSTIVEWVRENGLQRYGGATVKTLAEAFKISQQSFFNERRADEKFATELADAMEDFRERIEPILVKSLFNSARGYDYVQESEEIKYDKFNEITGSVRKRKTIHVEPNVNAGIFILSNLYPDRWKNKQTQELQAVTDEDKCIQVEVVKPEPKQLTADEQNAIIEEVKAIEIKE